MGVRRGILRLCVCFLPLQGHPASAQRRQREAEAAAEDSARLYRGAEKGADRSPPLDKEGRPAKDDRHQGTELNKC